MATNVTDTQTQYYLVSGSVSFQMPAPAIKKVPIRLYVQGAVDSGSPSTGIASYFITVRKSVDPTDETILGTITPSGLAALAATDKTGTLYQRFASGYEPQIYQRLDVESSPYFSGGTVEVDLYKNTSNPAAGMTYPSGNFTYSEDYVYMFQIYDWNPDTYYWFYVGSIDKAGNISKFSQMVSHPQNPFLGNIPSGLIIIPQEDTTPPTGMLFYY